MFTKYPKAVARETNNEIPIDASLRSYRCAKKPYISEKKNRKARFKFAKIHLNWNK